MSYIQEFVKDGTKEQWSDGDALSLLLIKQLMMEENLNGSINLQFLSRVQNVQLFETVRTVKMSGYNALEADDEERVELLEGLPAEQLRTQREEKQVSTETFTQEIANIPKQQENTIERTNAETIKENTSSNVQLDCQLDSLRPANFSRNIQLTSQQAKTDIEPKSEVLLLENSKPQQSNRNQKNLSQIERLRRLEQEIEDNEGNEFYARLWRQFQDKLKAQIKYLDDKKQERRKARQARQAQIGFMPAIRRLFNFTRN